MPADPVLMKETFWSSSLMPLICNAVVSPALVTGAGHWISL